MSTLIVQLPPRDPGQPLPEWQWPELAFALLDKSGHVQRAGRAALALLPPAARTVLVVAARDVLMLAAQVPPLKGQKLRTALPNIVEDQLIQDPQLCHVALDPQPLADGRRVLGVVDRAWLRFVIETFEAAGHRRLNAVPASRCVPMPRSAAAVPDPSQAIVSTAGATAELVEGTVIAPAVAAVAAAAVVAPVVAVAYPSPDASLTGGLTAAAAQSVEPLNLELVLARGPLGEGFAAPVAHAASTLAALAGDAPLECYELGEPGAEPQLASIVTSSSRARHWLPGAAQLPFETWARRALEVRFDLCQFEFETSAWRIDRRLAAQLRLPVLLVAATLLIAVIGMNVHWWQLSHQRDALEAQLNQTLLDAFPKTGTVLDPPAQMSRQLAQLRLTAGELSPNDFLAIASSLTHALGPIPVNGLATLDYRERHLEVTFKPGVTVDPGFTDRLGQNGLEGQQDSSTGKWTIRSHA